MKFFNGKSIGPINKRFIYNSDDEAIAIKIKTFNEDEHYVYLNGGFYFMPYNNRECNEVETKVLATYETNEMDDVDKQIAIVESRVGKGKCLLSGVHFEINATSLDNTNNENIRLNVFDKLMSRSDSNNAHSNHALIKLLFEMVFNI